MSAPERYVGSRALLVSFTLLSLACTTTSTPPRPAVVESSRTATTAHTSPAASSSSEAPHAVVETAPPQSAWEPRLKAFYDSYEQGPRARAKAYEALFAPRLRRFIGQTDLTREAALQAAERFFVGKSRIAYKLQGSPVVEGSKLRVEIEANWAMVGSAAVQEANDPYLNRTASEGVENRLSVELETDTDQRVVSYTERLRKRHFKVGGDAEEAAWGFVQATSRCNQDYPTSGAQKLPRGSVVEDTGHYIELSMCGPGPNISRLVRYQGDELWVTEQSFMLVPNPFGGSSVGGQMFLERTD